MKHEEKIKAATMDILQYAAEVMQGLCFDDYTEVGMAVGSALGSKMLTEYKKHDMIRNAQMEDLRTKVEGLRQDKSLAAEKYEQLKRFVDNSGRLPKTSIDEAQFNFYKNYYIEADHKHSELSRQYQLLLDKYNELNSICKKNGAIDVAQMSSKIVKLQSRLVEVQAAYSSNKAQLSKIRVRLSKEGIDIQKLLSLGDIREISEKFDE